MLMTIVTTLILGLIYPLVITAIAQAVFPEQANGQLIERNGKVNGARVIAQGFASNPMPAADGPGRKYPADENPCAMIGDPITFPFRSINWPLACSGNTAWAMAVITSG